MKGLSKELTHKLEFNFQNMYTKVYLSFRAAMDFAEAINEFYLLELKNRREKTEEQIKLENFQRKLRNIGFALTTETDNVKRQILWNTFKTS